MRPQTRLLLLPLLALLLVWPLQASLAQTLLYGRSLSTGSTGSDVSSLQEFLKAQGFFTYPEITGYFGGVTHEAVVDFQQAYGIDPIGVVGPATQSKILELISTTTPVVHNTYITNPTTVIREGSSGSSGGVSKSLFERQVDAFYDSLLNAISGVTDAIAESITTALLTVTGNASIGGQLTVSGNTTIDGTLTAGALSVASLSSTSAIEAPYVNATSTTATSTFAGGLAVGTDGVVYDRSSGYVGMGTVAPEALLHLKNQSGTGGDRTIFLNEPSNVDADAGDFYFNVANFDVNPDGRDNVVWTHGYNVAPGGGRVDPNEPTLAHHFETYYHDGADYNVEYHIQNIDTNGDTHRLLSYKAQRDGSSIEGTIASDIFNFYDHEAAQQLKFDFTTNQIYLIDPLKLLQGTNNVGWLRQRNAADSAYIDLIYANASDEIVIGGTMARIGNELRISGASSYITAGSAGSSVQIGKAGFGNKLTVRSNSDDVMTLQTDAHAGSVKFLVGSGNFNIRDSATSNDLLRLDTAAPDNALVLRSSGNFGIGDVNPGSRLSVKGNAAVGTSYVTTAAPSNGLIVQGNTGVGTTSPWRKLAVTGTVGFDGLTGSTGAGSLCLSSDNEVVYNAASDSCLPSLRSTKLDIEQLDMDALDVVAALESVSFSYKNSDGRTSFNGRNNAPAKIKRKSIGHPSWPPSPARTLNHETCWLGIPRDSAKSETALGCTV